MKIIFTWPLSLFSHNRVKNVNEVGDNLKKKIFTAEHCHKAKITSVFYDMLLAFSKCKINRAEQNSLEDYNFLLKYSAMFTTDKH